MAWAASFHGGDELRACRKAAGWTQKELAARSGFTAQTVKYHERRKGRLDGVAPSHFRDAFEAAGVMLPEPPRTFRPRHGDLIAVFYSMPVCKPHLPRLRCEARTRKGTPCRALALPGKQRCKFHGGMSTGPNSDAGKERIRQALKQRQGALDKG
ncbi:helix-turn-helix domain-containing protein [Mesorhizobium sp. Root157]|uniref:HGGxSTG domain-containing protein n=1 Tax=Mesorhizobium sp. Root157 TaxID=1736477 RepID=UPI0009EC124A